MQRVALVDEELADFEVPAGQLLLLLGEEALDTLEVPLLLVDQVELLVEQIAPLFQPLLLLAKALAGFLGLGASAPSRRRRTSSLAFNSASFADILGVATGEREEGIGLILGRPERSLL